MELPTQPSRRRLWRRNPSNKPAIVRKGSEKLSRRGRVTKQYLADPHTIVSSLNRLRSTEITSYLQYKQHAYMAVSLLSPGLKTEFEAHALQELQHADTLANRIQQLGGVPVFDLQELAGKAASIGVHPEQGTTLVANGGRKSHARTPTSGGVQRAHSRDWGQGSGHTTVVTRHPANDGAACQRVSGLLETLKRDPWVGSLTSRRQTPP